MATRAALFILGFVEAAFLIGYAGVILTETSTQPPTTLETAFPTLNPSSAPSLSPTFAPSLSPSHAPSLAPSLSPTQNPSLAPSLSPTTSPTLPINQCDTNWTNPPIWNSHTFSDFDIFDYPTYGVPTGIAGCVFDLVDFLDGVTNWNLTDLCDPGVIDTDEKVEAIAKSICVDQYGHDVCHSWSWTYIDLPTPGYFSYYLTFLDWNADGRFIIDFKKTYELPPENPTRHRTQVFLRNNVGLRERLIQVPGSFGDIDEEYEFENITGLAGFPEAEGCNVTFFEQIVNLEDKPQIGNRFSYICEHDKVHTIENRIRTAQELCYSRDDCVAWNNVQSPIPNPLPDTPVWSQDTIVYIKTMENVVKFPSMVYGPELNEPQNYYLGFSCDPTPDQVVVNTESTCASTNTTYILHAAMEIYDAGDSNNEVFDTSAYPLPSPYQNCTFDSFSQLDSYFVANPTLFANFNLTHACGFDVEEDVKLDLLNEISHHLLLEYDGLLMAASWFRFNEDDMYYVNFMATNATGVDNARIVMFAPDIYTRSSITFMATPTGEMNPNIFPYNSAVGLDSMVDYNLSNLPEACGCDFTTPQSYIGPLGGSWIGFNITQDCVGVVDKADRVRVAKQACDSVLPCRVWEMYAPSQLTHAETSEMGGYHIILRDQLNDGIGPPVFLSNSDETGIGFADISENAWGLSCGVDHTCL
ncbi:MAG: hypothetical protein ACTSUE_22910 [Promethearchaeota archaeon]